MRVHKLTDVETRYGGALYWLRYTYAVSPELGRQLAYSTATLSVRSYALYGRRRARAELRKGRADATV
jgi:hypothetical protein